MRFLLWSCCIFSLLTSQVTSRLLITECEAELEAEIRDSIFSQIPSMLGNATYRLQKALDEWNEQLQKGLRVHTRELSPSDRSTYRTFENMVFFQTTYIQHIRNREFLRFAIQAFTRLYLNALINSTKVMRDSITTLEDNPNKHLQISCDPQWLKPIAGATNLYWDDRETIPESTQIQKRQVSIPNGLDGFRRDDPDGVQQEVALYFSGLAGPYSSVIILNKHLQYRWKLASAFQAWKDPYRVPLETWRVYHMGQWIRDTDSYERPQGLLSLDILMKHHLSAQLLRSLSYLPVIMDDPVFRTKALKKSSSFRWLAETKKVVDTSVEDFNTIVTLAKLQPQGPSVVDGPESAIHPLRLSNINYQDSIEARLNETMRTRPQHSVKCATTFQYLVVALYLQGWDWSTGINLPFKTAKGPKEESILHIFPSTQRSKRKYPGTLTPEERERENEDDGSWRVRKKPKLGG